MVFFKQKKDFRDFKILASIWFSHFRMENTITFRPFCDVKFVKTLPLNSTLVVDLKFIVLVFDVLAIIPFIRFQLRNCAR